MTGSHDVVVELHGCIGIITLNHPPANELLQPEFIPAAQLLEWTSQPEVRGLIIRGAGRHFSSGADLESLFHMAADKDFLMEKMNAGKALLETITDLKIPVVAQISGVCFGGGLEIALACHLRMCSDNALFAFPEINSNLLPGLGGTSRICQLVGQSKGLSLLLSGDTLNAQEALQWGLVDACRPKNELNTWVLDRMEKMTTGRPRKVIEHIMQAWHNSRKLSWEAALMEETRLFYELAKDELQRRKSGS